MAINRTETLDEMRNRIDALLEKADATPSGEWHITEDEHALMVQVSQLFAVELPIGAFRSSEGAASFLRLCALALADRP